MRFDRRWWRRCAQRIEQVLIGAPRRRRRRRGGRHGQHAIGELGRATFEAGVHLGHRRARCGRYQNATCLALAVDEWCRSFRNPVHCNVSVCRVGRCSPKGIHALIKRDAYERVGQFGTRGTQKRGLHRCKGVIVPVAENHHHHNAKSTMHCLRQSCGWQRFQLESPCRRRRGDLLSALHT